jgi:hypothetical protein
MIFCRVQRFWEQPRAASVSASPKRTLSAPWAGFATAIASVMLICCFPLHAQQTPPPAPVDCPKDGEKSLADVAKELKKSKTLPAKKLITNDDLEAKQGPLPKLMLDGDDNSDEIIDAIGDYRAKHTAEETEQVVRDWWGQYDSILATAARRNSTANERRATMSYNGALACEDSPGSQTCQNRYRVEMHLAHDDQIAQRDSWALMGRIQQSFMKIRTGISRYRLQYSWFKIRNANGTSY